MLRGRLDRSGITIEEHKGELPLVAGSPAQLNQVFLNLLVNAMQAIEVASRADGRIAITTEEKTGEISVEIADNGCGIPEENLPRIFTPFFTTKGSRRRHRTGLEHHARHHPGPRWPASGRERRRPGHLFSGYPAHHPNLSGKRRDDSRWNSLAVPGISWIDGSQTDGIQETEMSHVTTCFQLRGRADRSATATAQFILRMHSGWLARAGRGTGLFDVLRDNSSSERADQRRRWRRSRPRPLASYVPRQDLVLYLEYQGLDAHAGAWQKTAAYRLLSETKLGTLLEDMAIQAIELYRRRSRRRFESRASTPLNS